MKYRIIVVLLRVRFRKIKWRTGAVRRTRHGRGIPGILRERGMQILSLRASVLYRDIILTSAANTAAA